MCGELLRCYLLFIFSRLRVCIIYACVSITSCWWYILYLHLTAVGCRPCGDCSNKHAAAAAMTAYDRYVPGIIRASKCTTAGSCPRDFSSQKVRAFWRGRNLLRTPPYQQHRKATHCTHPYKTPPASRVAENNGGGGNRRIDMVPWSIPTPCCSCGSGFETSSFASSSFRTNAPTGRVDRTWTESGGKAP